MLRTLYKFFSSMRLAIVLIVYLIGLMVVVGIWGPGALSPGAAAFSSSELNGAALGSEAGRISIIGSLVLVVLPVLLFALNLGVCAVSRIVKRIKTGSYFRRFGWLYTGPDLVHISILLFLLGGLLSHYGRIDGEVRLQPGEIAALNSAYMIRLEDFRIEHYESGQVKQYISSIQLLRRSSEEQQAEVIDQADITVNNPYSLGRLKIYQRSYYTTGELASGLQAVYDPGYPAIIAGIVFFFLGLCFILAHKIRTHV
ncbi:MAG: cytochrome c biogenesis protein ResB [Spirochaetia bacterium]|nr:cytochrome c biogenesis protein ResB [Spirochaetia bacterium]